MGDAAGWRFWIDRGGTFTDLIGLDPAGVLHVDKVLSQQPQMAGDPAVAAMRRRLGLAPGGAIPPGLIREVRLGTTVATNALLERHGAPVLLLINRGFADLLTIGDQQRPDLFALRIDRPAPLRIRVLELEGRLAADGRELEPLRLDGELGANLRRALDDGYQSVAVALLHATRNPAHERQLEEWLQRQGVTSIALSHQLSPQPRLVPRGQTALVEAAVGPVLRGYLDQVRASLGSATPLRVMRSSGTLAQSDALLAKDTILSGPAGGMVGAVAAAAAVSPGSTLVGFDMGGTSTDVFHFDPARGEAAWERSAETRLDGLHLLAPMLPVQTVAAGGGSILRCLGGRLVVGPESAGALPGPAGYGRGGPATITDANLLLGRLPAMALPPLFGPEGNQPVDLEAVAERFAVLAQAAGLTPEAVAEGALTLAIERMAAAIRRISIERGHALDGALLVCYGGAGAQHTCRLAAVLGIRQVLLHPLAGVLSAYGIGQAQQRQLRETLLRQPLCGELIPVLVKAIATLQADAREALERCGDLAPAEQPRRVVRLELRYPGSEQGLEVLWPAAVSLDALLAGAVDPAAGHRLVDSLQAAFALSHQRLYGYLPAERELVLERLMLELVAGGDAGAGSGVVLQPRPEQLLQPPEPLCRSQVWLEPGGWCSVPLWRREVLPPGVCVHGPALVLEPTTTLLLEPGWTAVMLPGGEWLLQHQPSSETVAPASGSVAAAGPGVSGQTKTAADPVLLELFHHRFTAIAEQMGVQLQRSSRSVNIRERLDFSCALFDQQGRLVANAPHIPVHLGSMGECVAALLADVAAGRRPPLAPGDVILSNDPYAGGTHLPDITAITPVFASGDETAPRCFVASRGHHADVGGISPGSMPAFSRSIDQEGLLLRNEPFLSAGVLDQPSWRRRFALGSHPVRNADQLLADLQAQVAANRLGVRALETLFAAEGVAVVQAFMEQVHGNAAEAVRRLIARLQRGSFALELDAGGWIHVAISPDQRARRLRIDFSGTSPQLPSNHNAPLAVTKAVVLYVIRCLVPEPIPLNAGCFEPIDLVVPPGCLLNPLWPAAVVAGNVETSQATANALFAALGVQAAAQGTMNNLSFGDAGEGPSSRQYYETICGGTGAGVLADGSGFAGASAVQSHMTNSRLTDPEILEDRYPVRLERFQIRPGSGGAGRWPGGDGVIRQWRALEPLQVSLLTGSRQVAPFGLAGGHAGACGANWLLRSNGSEEL
ncbi:MAG: hydantoinase B/oxoprolinase family protein, partial [Synechococcus sp. ELA057]